MYVVFVLWCALPRFFSTVFHHCFRVLGTPFAWFVRATKSPKIQKKSPTARKIIPKKTRNPRELSPFRCIFPSDFPATNACCRVKGETTRPVLDSKIRRRVKGLRTSEVEGWHHMNLLGKGIVYDEYYIILYDILYTIELYFILNMEMINNLHHMNLYMLV